MRYEVYKSDISADRLLLTEFAKKEIDESSVFSSFKDVYAWFLKIVVIYPNSRAGNINEFFVNDSGDNTLLAQLLSDFDTGIESISNFSNFMFRCGNGRLILRQKKSPLSFARLIVQFMNSGKSTIPGNL